MCDTVSAFGFCREWKKVYGCYGKGSVTAECVTLSLRLGGEEEPWWQGYLYTCVCDTVPAFGFSTEVKKNHSGKGSDTAVCVTLCLFFGGEEDAQWYG